MREAMAFSPGHITGLFQICRHDDALMTGSRGAGFSVRLGAESRVVLSEGEGVVNVHINGARTNAKVTEMAIRLVLGDERMDVDVYTNLQLPMSQGFGMSAAGALSSALALSELLGQGEDVAYEAAHIAEVNCGTGLGDVSAIRCGGMEYRKKEGLPPYGEVIRIPVDFEMVLARVGPVISTSSVILDKIKSDAINTAGASCVDRFISKPDLDNFLVQASEFMRGSGLMTDRIKRVIQAIGQNGRGSMCMVGNSVFAIGPDLELLARKLSRYGAVFMTQVDLEGPRLL